MNDTVKVQDDFIGFSLNIPKEWAVVSKEEMKEKGYDPRTLFKFRLPDNQLITVMHDGTCSEDQFDDAYTRNIETMGEHGVIHNEQIISGFKGQKVKRAFFDAKTPEDKIYRTCHDFILIKNYFVDFSGAQVSNTISTDDLSGLMNDPIAIALHTLVNSIEIN